MSTFLPEARDDEVNEAPDKDVIKTRISTLQQREMVGIDYNRHNL